MDCCMMSGACAPTRPIGRTAYRHQRSGLPHLALVLGLALAATVPALAQSPQGGPPVVGVVTADYQAMTESTEVLGRIQARQRVEIMARVTGFIVEQKFVEGTEVKKGDLLYRLERPPFEADVQAKQAAVTQAEAELENANTALTRADDLFKRQAGTQVTLDTARTTQKSEAAQLKAAQAQLRLSQINLDYTDIAAPIDGRIGRTSVTPGNVVGPTSKVLATIVSADPMHVTFSVPMRRVLEVRERYAAKGGLNAVQIRLRLPNGKIYDQVGKLDFVDVSIAKDTDTITLRGTIANPLLTTEAAGGVKLRELVDGEFVNVSLEAIDPAKVLAVQRAAILSDQQGDYIYVVNAQNMVEQRRVKLGQSTPSTAAVADGLKPGERVIVEGIQRAKPSILVAPAPATTQPARN